MHLTLALLTFEQYVRYVELSLRYQDIILGHLHGVSVCSSISQRTLTRMWC